MLKRILEKLCGSTEPMNLSELSRELGIERSALDGMLLQLVRQGKLKEIKTGTASCNHCRGAGACTSSVEGKVYAVVEAG
jgi:predicted transcriptional regulator